MSQGFYSENAASLCELYERADPVGVFPSVAAKFAAGGAYGQALDIGSGSGRDAAWLTRLGFLVTAIEPDAEMRERARALHPEVALWSAARLPNLEGFKVPFGWFSLMVSNGVFMHLRSPDRLRALRRLRPLLATDGEFHLNFRTVTPEDHAREMFDISIEEMREHAASAGFQMNDRPLEDTLGRKNLVWYHCVLKRWS
jgi:SAM-dependent methyltransferase